MLETGAAAPSFTLTDLHGDTVADPWTEGPVVVAFYKTTCPVCRMSAPMLQAMADSGAQVVAVGEDPPDTLREFGADAGLSVQTLTEPAPYDVSAAYGLQTVPSVFLIDESGTVRDSLESWDRKEWNRFSVAAGGAEVSHESDGLPPQRPG